MKVNSARLLACPRKLPDFLRKEAPLWPYPCRARMRSFFFIFLAVVAEEGGEEEDARACWRRNKVSRVWCSMALR